MNKKYIITKNLEIEKIIKTGLKLISSYFVIYYIENNKQYNRYVVSVSKKIGKAVVRNRIKRQIKDILAKNNLCFNKDYVIIVRNSLLMCTYEEIQIKLLKLIKGEN